MTSYPDQWRKLNDELHEIEAESGNLCPVFKRLHRNQVESGFIRGDSGGVQRYSFRHPEIEHRFLRIQYNPGRAARFRGAGVELPPESAYKHNGGCFLCWENILKQQEGRQLGYDLQVNDHAYTAWMNPFPLAPGHLVIASREHIGQEWSLHPEGELSPDRILADLVALAVRAPGYVGFYNGVNAGASISAHMHYHFFMPPSEHRLFPLQIEARATRQSQPDRSHWLLAEYPLETLHWYGGPEQVLAEATDWVSRWAGRQPQLNDLSANFIAVLEPRNGQLSLLFVPRDRSLSEAASKPGMIGGLEVLGELVFSTREEKALLDSGTLDYFNLEQVLTEISTPLLLP